MIRGAQVWVGASLFALAVSLTVASCTDSKPEAASTAQAGAAGAAGAPDARAAGAANRNEGGSSGSPPKSYADAGAPGAIPVCTTTLPPQCEVGEALVTSPERYCPYCRSCALDEKNACPPYPCGSAAHNEMAPGQCCSTCVPDDAVACAAQLQAYIEQRQPIYDQYVAPCKKDADCASALLNTSCEQSCVAAVTDSVPDLVADLAALTCPACPLQPPVSVRPRGQCAPASCVKGLCVVGTLASP